MRYRAIIFAIAFSVAAVASGAPGGDPHALEPQATAVQSLDMPSYEEPARKWESIDDAMPSPEECRDRIHQVREAMGQPKLEGETADPDKPMLIYAVDRREAGCSVLVIKGDPEDIRPLPEASGEVKRIPAN